MHPPRLGNVCHLYLLVDCLSRAAPLAPVGSTAYDPLPEESLLTYLTRVHFCNMTMAAEPLPANEGYVNAHTWMTPTRHL